VIVSVTIGPTRNVPKVIIAQMSQEARVALMPKVLVRNHLFEVHSGADAKGSPVGKPSHPLLEMFLGKDMVHFLGDGHFADLLGDFEVRLGRDRGEVSVGVVHVVPQLLNHLNDTGLDRKLDLLQLLASPRTLCFDAGRSGWRYGRVTNRSLGVLGYLVGHPNDHSGFNLGLCGIIVMTDLVIVLLPLYASTQTSLHPRQSCWTRLVNISRLQCFHEIQSQSQGIDEEMSFDFLRGPDPVRDYSTYIAYAR
jgi:hypothetical protein